MVPGLPLDAQPLPRTPPSALISPPSIRADTTGLTGEEGTTGRTGQSGLFLIKRRTGTSDLVGRIRPCDSRTVRRVVSPEFPPS